ncbi:hypothetical protein [Curtobacterium aetherium]|uniref:Uncharacterized protein n=1 Tax=Curtobacterium aetherium TaxID=2841594 RepID=A0ACD1E1M4_9MICO|nr:hypothetical protein [Curtobacterium sp. L6-1]QWS32749.1 hypothetical protein KM842_10735 [Curtobacterium sp. L6-1]
MPHPVQHRRLFAAGTAERGCAQSTAVELSKYRAIDNPTAFMKGQRLQMLVAPPITDEHDVAIEDEAARHRFEAAVRHDVILAATGGPAFGGGGTLFAMQLITSKRKKTKRA